jgi:hypothetical protein
MKANSKKMKTANKTDKRTRGYRLKPSTHILIIKIQKLMKSDQDEAIAGACNMFYAELKKNGSDKGSK